MYTVAGMDGSPLRQQAFQEIARRHRLIGIAYAAYRFTRRTPIAPLLLLAYGVKCYLTLGKPLNAGATVATLATYANERHAIAGVEASAPDIRFTPLPLSRTNLLTWQSWSGLLRELPRLRSLWRIARHTARRHDFMPACRIFSTVTYYLRARRVLSREPALRAVLTASNYSPEAVALMAAAMKEGRKVLYTNHANVPPHVASLLPLYADLAILTGQAMLDMHCRARPVNARVAYKGLSGASQKLRLDRLTAGGMRIGIFLTSMTSMRALADCLETLHRDFAPASLRVRPHPNPLIGMEGTLPPPAAALPGLAISLSAPLAEDIARCDLVICGNSGVVLEILKAGVPAVYLSGLDAVGEDYNGFIEQRLIPRIASADALDIEEVKRFFEAPEWPERMRYYDAGYGGEEAAMRRGVGSAISRLLTEASDAII